MAKKKATSRAAIERLAFATLKLGDLAGARSILNAGKPRKKKATKKKRAKKRQRRY